MSATLHLAQTLAEAHPGRAIGYTVGRIGIIVGVIALIVRACRKRRPHQVTPPAAGWPPSHPGAAAWPHPGWPQPGPVPSAYPPHPYPPAQPRPPVHHWSAPQHPAQQPWPPTARR